MSPQATLESLASLIGALSEREVEHAERMLAARCSFLSSVKLLTIPMSASVRVVRPTTEGIEDGNLMYHFRKSILVRFADGQSETVNMDKIIRVEETYWQDEPKKKSRKRLVK